MILGRLMDGLVAQGVILGHDLQLSARHALSERPASRKLPADHCLAKKHLDVFEVDAGVDYRLRALEQVEIYHYPSDAAAEKKMLDYFRMVAGEEGKKGGHIEVLGRNIDTVRRGHGVIWFDFRTLCGGPRSQNDYLEIARAYHTVLLYMFPK